MDFIFLFLCYFLCGTLQEFAGTERKGKGTAKIVVQFLISGNNNSVALVL